MGCDIHGFLEVRIIKAGARKGVEKGALWDDLHEIPTDRNYDFFGILAGVRNYVAAKTISEPKGLPPDLGWKAKDIAKEWEPDGHTHSWLSYQEIEAYDWNQEFNDGRISEIDPGSGKELGKFLIGTRREGIIYKHLKRKAGELISPEWKAFINYMAELSKTYGKDGVRIVFWFDN